MTHFGRSYFNRNHIDGIRTKIDICIKLIFIALSIILGVNVFQHMLELSNSTCSTIDLADGYKDILCRAENPPRSTTDSLSYTPDSNIKISELVRIRIGGLVTLSALIIFAVHLQLFTLKAVGNRKRVGKADVTANQVRWQIRIIWCLMLINIICINLPFLLGINIYMNLILDKTLEEQELFQNMLLAGGTASLTASLSCALVDIFVTYFRKFPVK